LVQLWKAGEQVLVPLGTGHQVQIAFDQIFELGLEYSIVGLTTGSKTRFQVSLWAENLPLQVVPPEGWLTVELTEDLVSW